MLSSTQIRRFYELHPLTVPSFWSLSRKHFRVGVEGGRFVKLNKFENRLTARAIALYWGDETSRSELWGGSRVRVTTMTPSHPKQIRLDDVWPWKAPRTRTLVLYEVPEDLLLEFAEEIVRPNYPKGVVLAILDLMQKAVEEQKRKRCSAEF